MERNRYYQVKIVSESFLFKAITVPDPKAGCQAGIAFIFDLVKQGLGDPAFVEFQEIEQTAEHLRRKNIIPEFMEIAEMFVYRQAFQAFRTQIIFTFNEWLPAVNTHPWVEER